jgi:fructokinase
VVSLDAEGKPTYAFHHGPVADRDIDAQRVIASLPNHISLLHTGGLALVPEDIDKVIAVMQAVAQRGGVLSVDANLRPIATDDLPAYRQGVLRALKQAHVIKVSDEDLHHLGFASDDLIASAKKLFDHSEIQLIALTLGANGAALITRSAITQLAPPKLRMQDTVGAGDCFQAGLISYLARAEKLNQAAIKNLDEKLLSNALRHAISAASINITRAGCDPATWDETVAFSFS